MGKVIAWSDRWFGRLTNAYTVWPLVPAGLVGAVTGYLSSSVAWISQNLGAFGFVAIGILSFLLTSLSLALVGVFREKLALASAARTWNLVVDRINPLHTAFQGERIRISDIAHPVTKRIKGKGFTNCEFHGPDNIAIAGGILSGVTFSNCDFVIIKENVIVNNVKVFENCQIIGGRIWNCTVFLTQEIIDELKTNFPVEAITYEKPSDAE